MTFGLRVRDAWMKLSPLVAADMDRLVAALQILTAPGAALTAANAGTVNSGDATTDAVIANLRTRVGELEALLQSKGLVG